jgi:hypothetical protein
LPAIRHAGFSEEIYGHSLRLLPADFQSQGVVQWGFDSVISPADRGLNNQSFSSGEVALYGPFFSVFKLLVWCLPWLVAQVTFLTRCTQLLVLQAQECPAFEISRTQQKK